jgi:hypothetical protein
LEREAKMEGFLYHFKVVNSNVQITCENNNLHLIILFQEIWFKYQYGILICYGRQQFLHLSFKVPSYQTWLIVKTIINTFSQLSNNVFWIKIKVIGCYSMHLFMLSHYLIWWKVKLARLRHWILHQL